VKGSITYNGHTFDEFIPERTSSYIDQQDIHLAELTVRETFDFAACCQGTGHKAGIVPALLSASQLQPYTIQSVDNHNSTNQEATTVKSSATTSIRSCCKEGNIAIASQCQGASTIIMWSHDVADIAKLQPESTCIL